MTRLAIIGSAGRKADAALWTIPLYRAAVDNARRFLDELPRPWDLVSGGAAYTDHVAVELFISGAADSLTLHLPVPFDGERFEERPGERDPGSIANYYHRAFSAKMRAAGSYVTSLDELAIAQHEGARFLVGETPDGMSPFHARNLEVGKVDVVLAYTFGEGAAPADGGTAHTWRNSSAPRKVHVPLGQLLAPPRGQLCLAL